MGSLPFSNYDTDQNSRGIRELQCSKGWYTGIMEKRPPLPPLSSRPSAAQPLPALPSLDRTSPPAAQQQPAQLTGPQRFETLEAKLAVQRSMVNGVIPVKITMPLPCGVAACLNYTSMAQVSYDLTFGQYRFSPICPQCQKRPRP